MRAPAAAFALLLLPSAALADFAEPPDGAIVVPETHESLPGPWMDRPGPGSMVRVHVGPALDLAHGEPGFHAALDVGRSAGFRAAGGFVALGSDGGAAIYSGELWLCPVELGLIRPIAGAGAGFRNMSRSDGDGTRHEHTGVAVLRGGLELLLPTREVESRASVSLTGYLPAIVSSASSSPEASVLLTASLAIGF